MREIDRSYTLADCPGADVVGMVRRIFSVGHAVHGFALPDKRRAVKILESRTAGQSAPIFGYGEGPTAEGALGRAFICYAQAKTDGFLGVVASNQYPISTPDQGPARAPVSIFDHMVCASGVMIYPQDDWRVIAESRDTSGSTIQGLGRDPDQAITSLGAAWWHRSDQTLTLPFSLFKK